eukprot:TRINITY_DN25587_c0_g1_i1.p1 TRINITY_DN25587_c0_g1~~TRINITY_DN25587_c0_g1_i1.p1  ORF type:complete len:406 (+),score=32.06 TRINITY_DN25587_c0_g1_i1:129-1346(+)
MANWFNRIFGFDELTGSRFLETRSKFKYDEKAGKLTSVERPDRPFSAGIFTTPSLEELRSRLPELQSRQTPFLRGRLVANEVIDDVSQFHIDPKNAGALFQCASQFNCLEHTSEQGCPEDGVTKYSTDMTQGPACAIACAPGTVVRNYFGMENKESQTRNRQVENLREIEELIKNKAEGYFQVMSGYTLGKPSDLERLALALKPKEIKDQVRERLRIGIQADTEVTSAGFGRQIYEGPEQIVTQAYCSAVSVSYSGCSQKVWEPLARCILESAYEATMIVAIDNAIRNQGKPGCNKVFLTALGGGVFGNDMNWIYDAMKLAFDKFKDWNLEVYLVSYGSSEAIFQRLAADFKEGTLNHNFSNEARPAVAPERIPVVSPAITSGLDTHFDRRHRVSTNCKDRCSIS